MSQQRGIDRFYKFCMAVKEKILMGGEKTIKATLDAAAVIPRPMKGPVGAVFFIRNDGSVDEEGIKEAEANNEAHYTDRCLQIAQICMESEDTHVVREVSVRHYYSTRYVLELAESWIRMALEKQPDLNDQLAKNIQWSIRTVIDEANKDINRLKYSEPIRRKMDEALKEKEKHNSDREKNE